jgi:two-component system, NarL family, nitrate/nitrite response regulator NarL
MRTHSVNAMTGRVGISCVVVDDSASFLELACSLLEQDGIEVVGTASSAAEALARVAELRPDVALVDIDLGADSGFDVTRDLASVDTVAILISAHAGEDLTDLIDASPALGFIPKADLSARAVHDLLDGDGRIQGGD